jgi:hypothetical protein
MNKNVIPLIHEVIRNIDPKTIASAGGSGLREQSISSVNNGPKDSTRAIGPNSSKGRAAARQRDRAQEIINCNDGFINQLKPTSGKTQHQVFQVWLDPQLTKKWRRIPYSNESKRPTGYYSALHELNSEASIAQYYHKSGSLHRRNNNCSTGSCRRKNRGRLNQYGFRNYGMDSPMASD